MNHIIWLLTAILCCSDVLADDHYCMDKAMKEITVSIDSDKPNKILTRVRDDPRYAKNLDCKWRLKASDYTKPRQMLLTMQKADFDTPNVTKRQCERSGIDAFTFSFSGPITKGQMTSERWCSNADVLKESKRILANLWNSHNYLTVEFKSDDIQTRYNRTGVEMDVLIMSENFCHKDMLFHNGSCYFISEPLNFLDSHEAAHGVMGNVPIFYDTGSAQRFLKSYSDRRSSSPYQPPFALDKPVWTGCIKCGKGPIQCPNHARNCDVENSTISLTGESGSGNCRIAMHMTGDKPVFTCSPMNFTTKLPALVEFAQISGSQPDSFLTCSPLTCRGAASDLRPQAQTSSPPSPPSRLNWIIDVALEMCKSPNSLSPQWQLFCRIAAQRMPPPSGRS